MPEEGSVSLRPRGFTPYHSFIINLHHVGPGELESCNRRDLFSSHSVAASKHGRSFSFAAVKNGRERGNDTDA